jgi:hypothetical protein
MSNWKLQDDVISAADAAGLKVKKVASGNSPFAAFDLILYPDGFRVGADPADYAVSPTAVKTGDPATAYKGRVGTGRIIMATPSPDGIVRVGSSTGDTVVLTLADGMPLGRKVAFALGDLFSNLSI